MLIYTKSLVKLKIPNIEFLIGRISKSLWKEQNKILDKLTIKSNKNDEFT
jgi:hypothetical protein